MSLRERTRPNWSRRLPRPLKCSAIILALATVTPASAKDCLKAHYAVHRGAVAGCILGHAIKRPQTEREKSEHPTPYNRE
jgi:hypothetical protein